MPSSTARAKPLKLGSLLAARLGSLLAASLGVVLSLAGQARAEDPGAPDRPPNVVLWVVSGLRADHVGAYGYGRGTTPRLDAFAARSLVFENAWASSPGTVPALTSLLTSVYPRTHGFEGRDREATKSAEAAHRVIPESLPVLAELFRSAGYLTVGMADAGNVSEREGFDRGFDHFDSWYRLIRIHTENALDFLHTRDRSRPFFLLVQTFQATSPYLPDAEHVARFTDPAYEGPFRIAWRRATKLRPSWEIKSPMGNLHKTHYAPLFAGAAPAAEDRAFLLGLYDACVLTVDEQFGRVLEYVEKLGELDRTVIVVTSDHGVAFWEHGAYGNGGLYEENLRIPLVVHAPGVAPGRSSVPVEQVDLLPTLLGLAGIAVPEHAQGRALDLAHLAEDAARARFAESTDGRVAVGIGPAKAQLGGAGPAELYLLDADPGETRDLAREAGGELGGAARIEAARQAIEAWGARCDALRQALGLEPAPR